MMYLKLLLLITFYSSGNINREMAASIFEVKKGTIQLHSNAELELIKATTDQLKGLVDTQKKTFAFKISMNSFRGFNSPLQQEHFNENYVETGIFPDASFSGKIIEDDDLSKDGDYVVRAKGLLTVHGVSQERIIRSNLNVLKGRMKLNTSFTVLLADHNIKIPRIVSEKLSAEIKVDVEAFLEEKK
jgi:polyisoprenoid-binding protein YceI